MIELLVGGRWWVGESRERKRERKERTERGRLRRFGRWVEGERSTLRGEGRWYRGQRVFRLRDGVRATALHKVGREDGGRRRAQCAGRVSNLEPTIGLPTWYQERPGSAKIHRDGMYVGGRYASPCLFYLFFRLLFSSPSFFRPLPRRAKGGQAYIRFRRVSYVSRLLVLTFSSPGHRACTPPDVTRARVSTFYGIARPAVFSISIETLQILPDRSYRPSWITWSIVSWCHRIFFFKFFPRTDSKCTRVFEN